MRQSAIDAWVRYAGELNPAGQYAAGRRAHAVLAESREIIGELLGADPVEVVFTGSGTESDNIALRGLYRTSLALGKRRVVASPAEHSAVVETVKNLAATAGAEVSWLPVTEDGVAAGLEALREPAAVATCMMANNETGAVQPFEQAATLAREAGTPFHIDAVQAVGKIPVDFHKLDATTLAASAHKFGGPRGTGILLARRSPVPQPTVQGGGQERGLRSGTVDVASAAATAAALTEAVAEMDRERERVDKLTARLVTGVLERVPGARLTVSGPVLPGHAHFLFPGADGALMIMLLDSVGIAASTGSACASGVHRMSHVLEAMGISRREGMGALRLTLGRTTTEEDVDAVVHQIEGVVEKATVAGAL